LDEIRVVFDLEDSWSDLGISRNIEYQGTVEVAETDVLDEAFLNQFFHGLVSRLDWGIIELNRLFVISEPFGRVAVCRVNILQGNWEVDVEKIEIFYSPQVELVSSQFGDMFRSVESVP